MGKATIYKVTQREVYSGDTSYRYYAWKISAKLAAWILKGAGPYGREFYVTSIDEIEVTA